MRAGGQQSAKSGEHVGVESAQPLAEPILQFRYGQGACCALQSLEQDRARSAAEGQFERGGTPSQRMRRPAQALPALVSAPKRSAAALL